jgi:hypothetical protein
MARSFLASLVPAAALLVAGLAAAASIAFFFVGGMFYRTQCPSSTKWTFDPIPFFYVVKTGEVACSTDTASGYYVRKVPVIGEPLRIFVRSWTGQG